MSDASEPLTEADSVAASLGRPLTVTENGFITRWITTASAKLRQQCPFDVDARIALYATDPTSVQALDPDLVSDVVATIIKRFIVNPSGVASSSDATGPLSHSATYVNRYDKTGSDVRGAIQVTDSDIDQLRPATPAPLPSTFSYNLPRPSVLIPADRFGDGRARVIPDWRDGDEYAQ